jgi:hypothetical protein
VTPDMIFIDLKHQSVWLTYNKGSPLEAGRD